MTVNKRFTLKLGRFYCDDIILQNETVLELLNENEELKRINGLLDDSRMEALSDLGGVIDENEQLKQSNKHMEKLLTAFEEQQGISLENWLK